ncbi:hypothetical protein [Granulicella arctica]|uniref:hypothetical protein n=1 Tax=Granulicella arctica TaxID=940613 RepID=UPI0021DF49FB|nr:hypothetical protein [Granulicella arctica]
MTTRQDGAQALSDELDQALTALTSFDVQRLEEVEDRIRAVTAEHLAHRYDLLPELTEKQARLGELLDVTAANLKVLVSVLNLEGRMETR